MFEINRLLSEKKQELLLYFRGRAEESLERIRGEYGAHQFRESATAINRAIVSTKDTLIKTVTQKALLEQWSNEDTLRCVLMISYASYVVMLEFRNEVWPYDYMSFSRRVGELWEPFCKLCFEYPISSALLFVPPLFSEVKKKLTDEIDAYIHRLTLLQEQKEELKKYYDKVWSLVTSGEVQLELDLHFVLNNEKYVVDFKSGFGSNEKGNTNRLLLVATVYKNLEENYHCLLLVRAKEDRNNAYFQTLKNSGIWSAYCGDEAYEKIQQFSGFDIRQWITDNVNWTRDLSPEMSGYLVNNKLEQYLAW